jgi:hypothetical protein
MSWSKPIVAMLIAAVGAVLAQGQTVLYDFDDLDDPFGHFGVITVDSGLFNDCGSLGNICATHTGNFTEASTSPHDFGFVEIGPFLGPSSIDMSAYVGYSVDARFIRDTDEQGGAGEELFTGLSPIKFGLQHDVNDDCPGSMDACSDKYVTPVELTETFQTITVMFADLALPGSTNLAQVQLKALMLTGEFNTALAPNRKLDSADFNASSSVDGTDYLNWQRNFGAQDPIFPGAGAAQFSAGNANYDTIVNGLDLAIWQSQYATDAPIGDWSNGVGRLEIDNIIGILPPAIAGVNQVPEPSTCWLACCCSLLLIYGVRVNNVREMRDYSR